MITEGLYYEMKKYIAYFIKDKVGYTKQINALEITHEIIVDEQFTIENWRLLVSKKVYQKVAELRIKKVELSDYYEKEKIEEKCACQKCFDFLPRQNFSCSYTYCDKCYRLINKHRINKNQKRYRQKHKNEKWYIERNKKYRLNRKEANSTYNKIYRIENIEKISERMKKWRHENKEKISEKRRLYYLKNKK